jgi:hypothetical protein
VIYRDRHGRWWCRMSLGDRRVWFCAATPHEAGHGAASVLVPGLGGGPGDYVFWRNRFERRLPGQNPHDVVPISMPKHDAEQQSNSQTARAVDSCGNGSRIEVNE